MSHVTSSPRVLEQTPARALTFLRGVGVNASIRRALFDVGYTEAVQQQGWMLLANTAGVADFEIPASASPVSSAISQVSAWLQSAYVRIHAALAHMHHAQDHFVFAGLESATGAASVIVAQKILERLDALDGVGGEAEARKAFAEADKKAIETLTTRGITTAERARIRDLLKSAQSAPLPHEAPASPTEANLQALKAWYDDWSETARAVITKRSDLIKLGLARRVARVKEPAPTPLPPLPVPKPVTPVTPLHPMPPPFS